MRTVTDATSPAPMLKVLLSVREIEFAIRSAPKPSPARAFYWLGRMRLKANGCWLVSSQLGTGHEGGGGPEDAVDDDWVCWVAGADRRTVSYLHMRRVTFTAAGFEIKIGEGCLYLSVTRDR